MYQFKNYPLLFIFILLFSAQAGTQDLNGEFDRHELEQKPFNKWFKKKYNKYDLDYEIIEEIDIPNDAFNVLIFMGTWDRDSRREIPQFMKIVDSLNIEPPDIILYGLDKHFRSIKKYEESWNIEYLPTIIYLLGEKELGRMNESPQYSLEDDLAYFFDLANQKSVESDSISIESEIFKVVDEMPRFPGCENIEGSIKEKEDCAKQKMLHYIYRNLKYPAIARQKSVEGMVVIQFIVDEYGWITHPNIVREIGSGCGDAAIDVINSMNDLEERWVPGTQKGRNVKVIYTLPVRFKLEG